MLTTKPCSTAKLSWKRILLMRWPGFLCWGIKDTGWSTRTCLLGRVVAVSWSETKTSARRTDFKVMNDLCKGCCASWKYRQTALRAFLARWTDTHTHAHTHALAQNCHCEFCCGMHFTCKNTRHRQCSFQRQSWRLTLTRLRKPCRKSGDIQLVKRQGGSWISHLPFPKKDMLCRYVGMISPDITISNHRLRGAVDGMRFTAPCQ